tara:strand:+ start:46 stop:570 length:525 start_codon:yes stop_codon:yes gene_type:complete
MPSSFGGDFVGQLAYKNCSKQDLVNHIEKLEKEIRLGVSSEEKLASCVEDSISNQLDNLNEAGGTDFSDIDELYDAYHQQTKTIEAQDLKIIQMEDKIKELEDNFEGKFLKKYIVPNWYEPKQLGVKEQEVEDFKDYVMSWACMGCCEDIMEELLENFRKENLEPEEEEDADNL